MLTLSQEIISRYQNGESASSLCKFVGVHSPTFCKALRRQGVSVRPANTRELTSKEQTDICEKYMSGKSGTELSIEYGVHPSSILNAVKRNGYTPRSISDAKRIYHIDETVFDDPLSDDAKYWIGFLIADGCIMVSKAGQHIIQLTLSIKDIGHIEKFRDFLRADYPITTGLNLSGYNTNKHHAKISITSKRLVEALRGFGVSERKTFSAIAHPLLESSSDFWRGAVDGDGNISIRKATKKSCHAFWYPFVELCGASRPFLEQFESFSKRHVHTNARVRTAKGRNSFIYSLGVSPAKRLIKLLYDGSSTYLDRKKSIADVIIASFGLSIPVKETDKTCFSKVEGALC